MSGGGLSLEFPPPQRLALEACENNRMPHSHLTSWYGEKCCAPDGKYLWPANAPKHGPISPDFKKRREDCEPILPDDEDSLLFLMAVYGYERR